MTELRLVPNVWAGTRHRTGLGNPAAHCHSFQPYALLDDDNTIYYVGYRCRDCGEAGYRVP